MLPGSEQYGQSVKGVVGLIDSLAGEGGSSMSAFMQQNIEDAEMQMQYVTGMMTSQQTEIDHVAKELLPRSFENVHRLFSRAINIKQNASALVAEMRLSTMADPTASMDQQQQVMQLIERLQMMRGQIESGFLAATDKPVAGILMQSEAIARRLDRAVRMHRDPLDEERGGEADDGMVALLQTETTAEALADRCIRILDELIEEMKYVRTMLRAEAAAQREGDEDMLEHNQQRLEQLIASVQWLHATGADAIAHSQGLRTYLRSLTASQFRTLQWYSLAQQRLRNAADVMDSVIRLVSASHPLLDEMLHYLSQGDAVPFTRSSNSALACDGRIDACGVCGGGNQTCRACDGVVRGLAAVDVCGECSDPSRSGANCSYFCDGLPDSGKVTDMCGVCGGDDSWCRGCDGIINSGKFFDRCGVCGGDGMSCSLAGNCAGVVCPAMSSCPVGKFVSRAGYVGCCFDPSKDCTASS